MNVVENVREALRSIRANLLRTVLTSLIIAVGISSLVGILTAIDGIKGSISKNFAAMGVNNFDISDGQEQGIRIGGRRRKRFTPIEYFQAKIYQQRYGHGATVSISTTISSTAQVKYRSQKTNPNTAVVGVDEHFVALNDLHLRLGRNFTPADIARSANVAIIAAELAENLFGTETPENREITVMNGRFRVIGILERKGNMGEGGNDRRVLMPIETARQLAGQQQLSYTITTSVPGESNVDFYVGEGRGLMRQIRRDLPGQPDSFELSRADAVVESIDKTSSMLRIGGFGIGFITLLGASIALMNILLVSVTERTREIGIRKSLGATPARIRQQFLIEAIVICLMGGLAGTVLALILGNVVSQLVSQGSADFVVPWLWLLLGLAVCVIVGLASGIYPAWKAARLDPIEALRYE